jgi:hypothetical protein
MRLSGTAAAISLVVSAAGFLSCGTTQTQKPSDVPAPVLSSTSASAGGMIVTDEMIGRSRGEMRLSKRATATDYGYAEKSPVRVGGGFGSGSERTYQFLNALRGPGGEHVTYSRIGTCCPFKSPNSPFDGEGLLEMYEINYPGASAPRRLYFDWYDEAEVLIPLGLTSASP